GYYSCTVHFARYNTRILPVYNKHEIHQFNRSRHTWSPGAGICSTDIYLTPKCRPRHVSGCRYYSDSRGRGIYQYKKSRNSATLNEQQKSAPITGTDYFISII